MLFKDIPGLTDIKNTLITAIRQGHVAHAQLFFGNEGGGSLAMALAYATYLNCEDKEPDDACGRCYSCIKLNKLIHPDFHQIFPVATTKKVSSNPLSETSCPTGATSSRSRLQLPERLAGLHRHRNKQANISAEESRQVIGKLSLKAFEAQYKVLLLWLPEMLHVSAANALLKILEEPPPKTVFLLVSLQPDKVLTTIRSRTQLVQIRAFSDAEIAEVLTTAHGVEPRRAAQIAQLSDGNLNRALRLTGEGREDHHEMFRNWMNLCAMRKYAD
jgi:DNA polymerase-3 subunit delta'